jgi:hypothetical protein
MKPNLRRWLGLALALFLLNSALSFHNVWPTLWIEVRPELSVEIAGLVVLLALWGHWAGPAGRRLVGVLTVLLLVMALGRYLEVTAPALYGRAINIYWDARYLPDVAAMFAASASWLEIALVVGGILAAFAVAAALLWWSLAQVRDALATPGMSGLLRSAAAFLVAAYFLGYYTSLPTLRWFSIPVSHTYARQASFVADALDGETAAELLPDDRPFDAIDPATLPAADVVITFVESYGAVSYDDPDLAATLVTPRATFEADVRDSGRKVVSALLDAPTFGGGSWLSHISFMTGLDISEAAAYDALLTQDRPTIPKLFGAAGFRTVALMPGLRNEWPEGSFYGFDRIYGAETLDYSGPEFGWWRIPDQFSLARLDALEFGATKQGRKFVFFPTISTHSPFHVPPYQPDWERIVSSAPYTAAELGDTLSGTSEWTNLRPAYRDSLAYPYAYWGGYLRRRADREFLLVLVGDHQPPANVSGEGARWDVPVHVVTADARLAGKLSARGFEAGMTPGPAPVAGMHELGLLLFD